MNPEPIFNIAAFLTLTLLWLVFGYGLFFQPGRIETAWRSFLRLPLMIKLIAMLLALPLVASLWVWNRRWPAALRLVLIAGLAWVTEVSFLPAALPF